MHTAAICAAQNLALAHFYHFFLPNELKSPYHNIPIGFSLGGISFLKTKIWHTSKDKLINEAM